MRLSDWLSIIALIVVPVLAVFVGQHLQDRAERRKDKMRVFKTLMTSRIYDQVDGWSREGVEAMNTIDVVFVDDKKVREAWKDSNDKFRVTNPDQQHLEKIRQAHFKLLEEMAKALGYKDKITWETIQNPYVPKGLVEQINSQTAYNQGMLSLWGSSLICSAEPLTLRTAKAMGRHPMWRERASVSKLYGLFCLGTPRDGCLT